MNKRILTLVLALVMILGLAVTSFAAPEVEKITNPKVQWLIDKNIVVGRLQDDGKTKVFDLDKTITREEVAKLVILYRGSENLARSLQGTKGIFKDVAIDRWSNGYINVAALADLIVGYPDGNFGPDKDITYAEIAAILVRMNSKWTAADEKAAIWPISFIKAAEEFGILKGIKLEDANAPAVREKVFEMMYNAFDGKYQAPIVNDRLGVVSRIWGDSIQLNGDVEYKVTKNTIFVGKSLNVLYKAKDFFGSLVRIAVNNDNEITHLIVLGSDKLAQPLKSWDAIADGGVISDVAPAANIKASSDDKEVVFDGGPTLKITDKTRFFVADTKNENFFEAKKLSDAIDTKVPAHLVGVYAAYDVQPVTGVKYAKVVVFSEGKLAKVNKNLARITASVAAGYDFRAEDTKAVETEYSVAKANKFPYNYKLYKMDVVNLHMNGDKDVVDFDPIIDYDKDPVFEVVKINDARFQKDGTIKFDGNEITLKDKHGKEKVFALDVDGVSVFTNALGKGAAVQVHYADKNKQIIDVISKVDKKVDGEFPGYVPGKECGIFHSYDTDASNQIYVKVKFFDDKAPQNYKVDSGHASLFVNEFKNVYGIELTATDYQGKDLSAKKIEICGVITDVVDKTLTNLTLTEDLVACKKAADDYIAKVAAYDFTNNIDNGGSTAKFKAPGTATDEALAAQIKEAKELADAYDKLGVCAQAKVDADTATKNKVDDIKEALAEEEANPRATKPAVEAEIKRVQDKLNKAHDDKLKFADEAAVEAFIKTDLKTNLIDDSALNVVKGASTVVDGVTYNKYEIDFVGKDLAVTSVSKWKVDLAQ